MEVKMSRINIRVDDNLKEQASEVYKELGLDLTTAITIFLKQSVREQAIPFRPTLENPDSIQARKDVDNGNLVSFKSLDELWEDLNEN